ncbi:OPT superfamily oligopeptide transporter, partial [Neoconidiobolus thromboides FSU 785]
EDSPIKIVRYTVNNEDNIKLKVLTVRVIIIGVILNILLSILNHFLFYLTFPMNINSILIIIITYPMGLLVQYILPKKIRGYNINDSTFNYKEHTLILIFCSSASSWPYSLLFLSSMKYYFNLELSLWSYFLFLLVTQLIGISFSFLYYNLMILNYNLFWPTTLISINLIRTIHNNNLKFKNSKFNRIYFFFIISIFSLCLYFITAYFFKWSSMYPILCIFNSPILQQLGSPLKGLGILVISLDWSIITSSLGSPLITPFPIALNMFLGFLFFIYLLLPLGYYLNLFNSKLIPLIGFDFYDQFGNLLNLKQLNLNNNQIHISLLMYIIYGTSLACLASIITYIPLNYINIFSNNNNNNSNSNNIHSKLILKNYSNIPNYYYYCLIITTILLIIIFVFLNQQHINLPYYGWCLAIIIAIIASFLNGILYALSSQLISIHFLSELIASLLFPNNEISNMLFKTIAFISNYQSISYLYHLKLGHYMKIPPKLCYFFTIFGILITSITHTLTSLFININLPNLCQDNSLLLLNCNNLQTFSKASILWGKIGIQKLISNNKNYNYFLIFLIVGFLLPIINHLLKKKVQLLNSFNIPIFLASISLIAPAYPFQYPLWFAINLIVNKIIYNKFFNKWVKYHLIFSAAMDFGVSIGTMLILSL